MSQSTRDSDRQVRFKQLNQQLAKAQRDQNKARVYRLVDQILDVLGPRAGQPEVPDKFLEVPRDVPTLSAHEIQTAFKPILRKIPNYKWWHKGLDPTTSKNLPREVASVISGCLAIYRAGLQGNQRCLELAKDAGEYLIWTQQQGRAGVIPFPASRNGRAPAFKAVKRLLKGAKQANKLDEVVRNGWVIDDTGNGGLQFDNGECGVALFELYEATGDRKYLGAAKIATNWAVNQPVVPNWNYNSFSVYLLAKAYEVIGEERYLTSAKAKAELGLYPGQLTSGAHKGRWLDPHNARPVYHYIIVRSLAKLMAVMSKDDPERPHVLKPLLLALKARNRDFVEKGITNKNSAMEALLLVKQILKREKTILFSNAYVNGAFGALERRVSAEFQRGRMPLSPGIWGRYLEYASSIR